MRDFASGESALDRALRRTFPKRESRLREAGLGGIISPGPNVEGQSPGLAGRRAAGKMGRVLDDLPAEKCAPWMNEECLLVMSRFLEETFRNFQLNVRPPSHIEPPFTAKPIDAFPAAVVVAAFAATFTTIVEFRVPQGCRASIQAAGQSAESAAAFADIAWRIEVDGTPYDPWTDVRIQLWEMVPPTPLCAPLNLREGQLVRLTARGILAAHSVLGRLCGYFYKIRAETGDEVKSTIVD